MDEVRLKATSVGAEKLLWSPTVGRFTHGLAKHLAKSDQLESVEAFHRVGDEAARVLGQCLPPGRNNGQRTGLVIGYVQSGKTMSMTAVSAIARDNRFRLIIAISGTTDILSDQSAGRFEQDLRQAQPADAPLWVMWRNPTVASQGRDLQRLVGEWRRAATPEEQQQALFISVMKNHAHLRNLAALLQCVQMGEIDALIIDDEADQASLNTRPKASAASTTYARLRAIRGCLPKHTYLQYTATAQSLILISLLDMLSPDFADVLEAGEDYTGGKAFFSSPLRLISEIPRGELPAQVSADVDPPPSLLRALRVFFLAAVASPKGKDRIRSMLVHPDRLKGVQNPYYDWVVAVKDRWSDVLRRPQNDPERVELAEEFLPEYEELKKSVGALSPLAALLETLAYQVGRTQVTKVNTDGSEVSWPNGDFHILVGGQKLDRGYTVKGLVVTYMPRGPGTWTADTIQQRARFFGYKRSYLGFCRVYLESNLVGAYQEYVSHEEALRAMVQKHRGRPTRELRRAFVLDPNLEPTRKNVLTEPFFRRKTGIVWFKQKSPHVIADMKENARRIEAFALECKFSAHPEFSQHHRATGVPLDRVLDLLGEYAIASDETLDVQVVVYHLMQIAKEHPNSTVTVLKMAAGERTVRDEDAQEVELHAGPSQKTGTGAHADIFDADHVTLQLYLLQINARDKSVLATDVAALAVRIPPAFGELHWLVQPKRQQK